MEEQDPLSVTYINGIRGSASNGEEQAPGVH
jgi:hypothetical protein